MAIVSAIAAPEIMFQARSKVAWSSETRIYSTAAALYLALNLPLA